MTVYRAADVTLDDADDVEAAIANGTVEPAGKMVVGETLVVAVDSDRLAESMADGDGSTTERFLDALAGNATLRIAQTNPTPERPRKVTRVGRENVTVLRAGTTTTYVLVDTGALEFYYDGSNHKPAEVRGGERFAVSFGYDLSDDTEGPTFELYTTKAEFLSHERNEPLPPEVVNRSVKVNVEPDDSLVARLTLGGDETVTDPVEPVSWSGVQGVSFDLRGVDPGTEYALELVHDGAVIERYSGTVLEPHARVSDVALTEVESQVVVTKSGERVTERIEDHTAVDATMMLSHGGRVVVLNESCEVLGSEWVEPGVETRVAVDLWDHGKPIRDRDPSEFGVLVRVLRVDRSGKTRYPGPDAETAVNMDADECRASSATTTQTDDPPETTPPTETHATSPASTTKANGGTTDTGGESGDGQSSTGGQPGFTVLVTLVALVVLALVRTRRT
ncbi:PGF-CTERM sorting domain-containing protein [Halobacteriaceae archaeon GCM10025711]